MNDRFGLLLILGGRGEGRAGVSSRPRGEGVGGRRRGKYKPRGAEKGGPGRGGSNRHDPNVATLVWSKNRSSR